MDPIARIIVWDVGHGSSISIQTDSKSAMLDLGANTETEFSPIKFTKAIWGIKALDYLVISHPHVDHIRDILNLDKLPPQVLRAKTVDEKKLIPSDVKAPDRAILEAFLKLKSGFNTAVSPDKDPRTASWGSPGYFTCYSVDADWETEPNNTSIVTFFKLSNFTFLYPGDIESKGWEELLKNDDFVNDLKTTSVFVASHHGREVGFSQEALEIARPQLVVVSDSWFKETSITSKYSNQTSGFTVEDKNKDVSEKRKVVSTRNDGRIVVNVYYDGSSTKYGVNVERSEA